MYIHSYQIHNVLNVYRKQLSQGTLRENSASKAAKLPAADRINISTNGQRQSLFEKITAEIVERITQFGPETQFEGPSSSRVKDFADPSWQNALESDKFVQRETAFTYTTIDEHNQKKTNTLSARPFGLATNATDSATDADREHGVIPEAE